MTYKINRQINPHKYGLWYKVNIIGLKSRCVLAVRVIFNNYTVHFIFNKLHEDK